MVFFLFSQKTDLKFQANEEIWQNISVFPENRLWYFMQIVSWENNLHEMSNPIFYENIFKNAIRWNFYPVS